MAMRSLIRAGIKDKSIGRADVKMIAFTLAGALNWPARWHDPKGKNSVGSIAADLVDILMAGLAWRGPPSRTRHLPDQ